MLEADYQHLEHLVYIIHPYSNFPWISYGVAEVATSDFHSISNRQKETLIEWSKLLESCQIYIVLGKCYQFTLYSQNTHNTQLLWNIELHPNVPHQNEGHCKTPAHTFVFRKSGHYILL